MRLVLYGPRTSAPWGTSGRCPADGVPRRDAPEASVLANAGRAYAFPRRPQARRRPGVFQGLTAPGRAVSRRPKADADRGRQRGALLGRLLRLAGQAAVAQQLHYPGLIMAGGACCLWLVYGN